MDGPWSNDSTRFAVIASGTLENKRPDFFRQAGIVIDVIDSQTNKLVYRGFSKNDVVNNASADTRASRINAAVAE